MPASFHNRLTLIQAQLLQAFFERNRDFFLSGGAALAGFYLGHRETRALDLFAIADVDIDQGVRSLRAAADSIGALVAGVRENPDFRRLMVTRGEEGTLVDLVIARAPQLIDAKPEIGSIRIDSLEEIVANKMCALLGRAEIRDLFDIKVLMEHGHRLEDLLARAQIKEGGMEPAALAWVLSELHIGEGSPLPAGEAVAVLDDFRRELATRLARLVCPAE